MGNYFYNFKQSDVCISHFQEKTNLLVLINTISRLQALVNVYSVICYQDFWLVFNLLVNVQVFRCSKYFSIHFEKKKIPLKFRCPDEDFTPQSTNVAPVLNAHTA